VYPGRRQTPTRCWRGWQMLSWSGLSRQGTWPTWKIPSNSTKYCLAGLAVLLAVECLPFLLTDCPATFLTCLDTALVDCPAIPDLNTPAVSFAVPTPPNPPLQRERGARGGGGRGGGGGGGGVGGNPVVH